LEAASIHYRYSNKISEFQREKGRLVQIVPQWPGHQVTGMKANKVRSTRSFMPNNDFDNEGEWGVYLYSLVGKLGEVFCKSLGERIDPRV
jgi:hypothetical protein